MSSCPISLGKAATCVDAVKLSRLEFTIQFCSISLLYFDYILSLKDEIQYVWHQRWRLTTLFYIFCRYSLISNVLYVLAISEDVHLEVSQSYPLPCSIGYIICGSLSILGHIGVISIWTLRTSAVYDGNRWVLGLLGSMGAVVVILLIVSGRHPQTNLVLGANLALLTSLEVISFLLAAYRVWNTMKESRKESEGKVMTLNKVIFDQDSLSASAVVLLHTISLVVNFKERTGFLSRLLNGLKLPLTGALSARFMLRLRACDVRKRLNPDLSFIDRALPPLEQQSILEEFQSDIGVSAFDDDVDLDGISTPATVDTGSGEESVSSRRGSDVATENFVEGSSTGPATADPRKLKQRRQGVPPDLEEGLYSPPASASCITI
ncbi:hypothetical protein BKA70DRAFT_1339471 [Coprinopsis sp. MPI-PUGE-AT-0042]|nr:hypothetical protein BKA70DRAFT_1339471 [Coprinopsis sp. MPI-PUGE-AT-0042]